MLSGAGRVDVDPAPEVRSRPLDAKTYGSVGPGSPVTGWPLGLVDLSRATVLTVPAEAVASRPTMVTVHGEGATAYGHLVVDVQRFAQAVIVLDHRGTATYADNIELVVGDGAEADRRRAAGLGRRRGAPGTHHARVGRDARLKTIVVSLGGDVVRVSPSVTFSGTGGDAELLGLYFADAGQHLEHRSFVDHSLPHCRSRVTYKGALQGQDAHTVWIGDVLIRAGAEGTDTYELNRNLLLTDGARADSVPNLEIETGEIEGAGHASATGRFDDEALFYLQSRGIPEHEARRLVVRGFFVDVIGQIGIPVVQERLTAAIETELARAMS